MLTFLSLLFTDAHAFGKAFFGQGNVSIGVSMTNCNGSESSVLDCSYSLSTAGCTHADDAGVRCSGEIGLCEAAGFTGCCISGCNQGTCWCDQFCHNFGDCCVGIENSCPQCKYKYTCMILYNVPTSHPL